MKERAALSDRLRSFGPVTSKGAVAEYLSGGILAARERGLKIATHVGGRVMLLWRFVGGLDQE